MLSRRLAACRCVLMLGFCLNSSGCILLGVYPIIQDVTGPVRAVRVLDAESGRDIRDAQASLNIYEARIYQYKSEGAAETLEDEDALRHLGLCLGKDGFRDGLLTRNNDGTFDVPKRILPGIEPAFIGVLDGYVGPISVEHGEFGYRAVVTASAPGYKPSGVSYHAPLFATFEDDRYDPRSHILSVSLHKLEPEERPNLKQVPSENSENHQPPSNPASQP